MPAQSSHVPRRCNQSVWCNIRQRSHYSIEPDLAKTFTYFSCRTLYGKRLVRGLASDRLAEEDLASYVRDTGAHWLRLIVGSAGGMSRMVRWPRKKPSQNK